MNFDRTDCGQTVEEIYPPYLVADPSGEESHELRGLVALSMSVLNGFVIQEVVQLDGEHGTRHLLITRRLLPCVRPKIKKIFKLGSQWAIFVRELRLKETKLK